MKHYNNFFLLTLQLKVWGQSFFLLLNKTTFIQQEHIQFIKIDSNAVLLNFLFIVESWKNNNNNNVSLFSKILGSTGVFNIDNNQNVTWAPNQHIRMISER